MKRQGSKTKDEFEARPDGWERFEKAVDAAIKSGPIPKPAPKQARKTTRRKAAARKP